MVVRPPYARQPGGGVGRRKRNGETTDGHGLTRMKTEHCRRTHQVNARLADAAFAQGAQPGAYDLAGVAERSRWWTQPSLAGEFGAREWAGRNWQLAVQATVKFSRREDFAVPRTGSPARCQLVPAHSPAPNSPAQFGDVYERLRPAPPTESCASLCGRGANSGRRPMECSATPCLLHTLRPGTGRAPFWLHRSHPCPSTSIRV